MTAPPRRPLDAASRFKKLRAMSFGELWTRARYDAYCRLERARHARGSLVRARPPGSQSHIRERRTARFYPGAEDREATRTLFKERFPAERERARQDAERSSRREFSFFGGTHRYGARVAWHDDPVTGRSWPRVYHRDVPVHGGNVGFGDVKHVWELGRHQFLVDLAKAWAIEGDARSAAVMRELLLDWRAENPVGTGVGWSCSLEPAFRILSWLWSYFLTLDDPAFDADSHAQWLDGFHEHGWFLYRHLEYYASPFNHLAGEACALYCVGVLFPEFPEAAKWRSHGRAVLESRLATQFYADGGSVEQSTFYHHATTGFYLLAALLGRVNGEEFSREVWRAIERAVEFSMLMQQPDGTTPPIGGADDGKPIRLEQLPLWDFRPYQAVGAVVFGRQDFKAAAGRFHEDALWLLGPDGARAFDTLGTSPPAPPSRVLEASGYVIMRSAWSPEADYLCFDCGEQAAGLRRDGIPSAAHGHADCLSIVVWRKGRPVLVDSGFHTYNGAKPWQDHFRETAAHNTVRVDGRDQAQHINKMAWSHTYSATLEGHDLTGSDRWAVASHDGYRSLPGGAVVHRRAVWMRPRGYIVVADWLDGDGSHDVELMFQFAPGRLRLAGTSASFGDRVDVHWHAPGDLRAETHEGGDTPDAGWIAPSLGVKTAAPRLVLSGHLECPITLITVIADAAPERLVVSFPDATHPDSIRISGRGWTEEVVARGAGKGANHRLEGDALLAAWRDDNGRLVADGRVAQRHPR